MRNFIQEVEFGRAGGYKGLDGGLDRFDSFTNGIQKASYYAVGAPAKAGKTAFVDYHWVISPFLMKNRPRVNWIYYSYEISELEKIAKFTAYFIYYKYKILCDSNYILSRGVNHLKDEHLKMVEDVYKTYIIPMFGEKDDDGVQIKKGVIDFHEDRTNPTGIRNHLFAYAEKHGKFVFEEYNSKDKEEVKTRIVGYRENDPSLYTIVILDHVGLMRRERGFNKKENIDKLSEYFVFFRNICKFTPVAVSQFNRELSKIDRLKFSGEDLQPTIEDFKDTGSLSEDASMVIGLFNPTKYSHLSGHIGYDLKKIGKGYRSAHILASRNTETQVNISLHLDGETGLYRELPLPDNQKELEKVYKYVNTKNKVM
jgi:replicative DNA helicase